MTCCTRDPGSLRSLSAQIHDLSLSPVDLAARYLSRIDTVQPIAEPWREVDRQSYLEQAHLRADQARQGQFLGPLHGIPVGIKDIIDVAGLPTRCNNIARQNIGAAKDDAEIVRKLRAAGAIILGKLHTTEFAYFDPSPARNPCHSDHTPGGSSSGSGAAVSSGTVPLALGTQTVASVIRPAAYCGISAFKPTTGSTVTHGVSALAPSFDTIGFYGWSVDDAAFAYEALYGFAGPVAVPERTKIVFPGDPLLEHCGAAMGVAVEQELNRFADMGHSVHHSVSPVSLARLGELNIALMEYETAHTQAGLLELPKGSLGVKLREAIERGGAISDEEYLALRSEANALRSEFYSAFDPDALFFWPAVPGSAPKGLESTGDPRFISPWTVLGGPMLATPTGQTENGLPLGCFLSARPGCDLTLSAQARQLFPNRQAAPARPIA